VAKLPRSFRERNRTARSFREAFSRLPKRIRDLSREACLEFDRNPDHPSFRHHRLQDNKKGQHKPDSFSVSITMQYRAVYFVGDDGVNVWYWIGTHADFDVFAGRK